MLPDVEQAEGLNATFYCQLPNYGSSIEWKINGTSFRNINTQSGIVRQGCGEETEVLIIHALPQLTLNLHVLHLLYKVIGHTFSEFFLL